MKLDQNLKWVCRAGGEVALLLELYFLELCYTTHLNHLVTFLDFVLEG